MSKVLVNNQTLTDIADAIRTKNGTETTYKPSEMATAIESIQSGGSETSSNIFTGSYDREGLKAIGWTDEEVDYYNANGVQWFEEQNDLFKLTDEELLGDEAQSTRFLPSNYTITSFQQYRNLIAIPHINESNPNNLNAIFRGCSALKAIPQISTNQIIDMSYMFNGCASLRFIPQLDTSNVTNMNHIFYGAKSLITIPSFNTNNVTNMTSAFQDCNALKTIPNINTYNLEKAGFMFFNCYTLFSIPELDMSKVDEISSIFNSCSNLQYIGGLLNLGKSYISQYSNLSDYSLNLNASNYLLKQSLLNVINGLYDLNLTYNVANGGTLYTQKLTLGSTNLAKLTAEEIAIATEKGWSVS